jgi:hypothetical protein
MAEGNGYSLADIAAAMGGNNGMGGSWLTLLFLIVLMGGNGFGFGNNGFANAIGYENLATSNEVQRGFDNQNSMGNQREILAAVTNGTAQSVAATNQAFHDNLNVIQDKYGELTRDIYGVSGQVAQVLANQNACCCDTKMLIQETSAQNRYDALKNTNDINAVTIGQTQKILDALAQNKINDLEKQVSALQLQNAVSNVVRYPVASTYNAGPSPFCNCGFNGLYA